MVFTWLSKYINVLFNVVKKNKLWNIAVHMKFVKIAITQAWIYYRKFTCISKVLSNIGIKIFKYGVLDGVGHFWKFFDFICSECSTSKI